MNELNKYKLDFEVARIYVEGRLRSINALSIEVRNLIDFKTGYFFTLLPKAANIDLLYNFTTGGILPQYLEMKYNDPKITSTYQLIPHKRKELANIILEELQYRKNFSCIFDDVSRSAQKVQAFDFFVKHGLLYEEEIYYFLTKENATIELIMTALDESISFWHSLCLLTTADFNNIPQELTREKVQEIASKSEVIIVDAYDGEGYVFWEKNSTAHPFGGPCLA